MSTRTTTRVVGGLLVGTVLSIGLSGCFAGKTPVRDVSYSASVEGGTITTIDYDLADAKTVTEKPAAASWSKDVKQISLPMLYVTPSDTGIAHCKIVDSNNKVLAEETGKLGQKVQCTIPI
jgi:hypothetical protein